MITYVVRQDASGCWYVIVRESGVVVSGPHTTRERAQTESSRLAGTLSGLGRAS